MTEDTLKQRKEEELSPAPEAGRSWGRWVLAAVAVVVVVLALVVWLRQGSTAAEESGWARTAKVEQRDFVPTIRVHGTVAAVESFAAVAPRLTGASRGGPGGGGFSGGGGMAFAFVAGGGGQMTITKLVSTGTRVKAGDVVVEFDPQDQERAATEQENQFKDYEEQIKRIVAEQEATKAADDTSLEQARNAVSAAKLELRKNEVISKIDAEKNQQNLEEAEARLKQLQQTYNLKRAAAQAALRITEIQRERSQKALEHARDNMQKMAIRTEMDGMVVISTNFNVRTGVMTDVQEGDQVNAGSIILQVVNPDKMEVRARINQADIAYLRDDAPVKVRLDAYPDLVFNGRVDTFSAIATTSGMSSKVRYFNARFAIDGSDPKLLPDLSAAVDVELDRIPNALVLPRDAIFYENDQAYVNVQRGGGWEKRAVKLGKSSDYEIVVESGVQAGEVVQRAAGRAQGGVR